MLQTFKDKMCLFYVITQRLPCSEHTTPRLYKTSLLTLYEVKASVCSAVRAQHISAV